MRAAFPGNHFCARVSVRTEMTMIVFVPNAKDPLIGTWCDLPRQQRVKPSAIRTIWRARTMTKYLEGGMPLTQAKDDAAAETASMLGLTLRTVRAFCNLPRGPQDAIGRVGRRGGRSGQADAPGRDVGQANANGGPTGGTGSLTASNLADGRGNGRAGCFCLRRMANGQ